MVFAMFEPETRYFGPGAQQTMLHFRARDPDCDAGAIARQRSGRG